MYNIWYLMLINFASYPFKLLYFLGTRVPLSREITVSPPLTSTTSAPRRFF